LCDGFIKEIEAKQQAEFDKLQAEFTKSLPEIGEVFSRFAYGGVLKHNRTPESQRPLPIGEFIDFKTLNIIKFPVSKYESIYRPRRLQSKSNYQVYSALFAFEFVKHGFASDLVAEYRKIMKEEFLFTFCLNCGKKLEQNSLGRKRKYCSISCKTEWEKTHRKSYTSYCEYCGNEFKILGIKGRKYCSHSCYTKDRFWREEDAAEVASK